MSKHGLFALLECSSSTVYIVCCAHLHCIVAVCDVVLHSSVRRPRELQAHELYELVLHVLLHCGACIREQLCMQQQRHSSTQVSEQQVARELNKASLLSDSNARWHNATGYATSHASTHLNEVQSSCRVLLHDVHSEVAVRLSYAVIQHSHLQECKKRQAT
jgi:hypothetical protein